MNSEMNYGNSFIEEISLVSRNMSHVLKNLQSLDRISSRECLRSQNRLITVAKDMRVSLYLSKVRNHLIDDRTLDRVLFLEGFNSGELETTVAGELDGHAMEFTALQYFSFRGNWRMIHYLCGKGANLNVLTVCFEYKFSKTFLNIYSTSFDRLAENAFLRLRPMGDQTGLQKHY